MAALPPPLRLTESPPDELIEEIFLRLPPDDPSCLLRASLVCKTWRRMISHRRFRRCLHELHGKPPVLGFLRNNRMAIEDFIATTASAFSLTVPGDWRALDCRHGRALLLHIGPGWGELILWDPLTGVREQVPVPQAMWDNMFHGDNPTAAIVCAAAGCDHGGCLGRPFHLVMVYSDSDSSVYQDGEDLEWVTLACSYSSETGEWGDVSWIEDSAVDFTLHTTSVLVGDSLLYFLSYLLTIIEYDLAWEVATTISAPELEGNDSVALILTEDGGLGVADSLPDSRLNIWSRVVSDDSDALWVKSRVICLVNLLPAAALGAVWWPMSFGERKNALFITTCAGIFKIELESEQVKKVYEDYTMYSLVPIESFYTPRVSGGEGEYKTTPYCSMDKEKTKFPCLLYTARITPCTLWFRLKASTLHVCLVAKKLEELKPKICHGTYQQCCRKNTDMYFVGIIQLKQVLSLLC